MFDQLFLVIFPYVAVVLAISATLYRYFTDRYSFSSRSSQFLENRRLFWGSIPWHYGIVFLLLGHLVGLLIPAGVEAFDSAPLRLYILEGTALALGLFASFGIITLTIRRVSSGRLQAATSLMDIVVLALLVIQTVLGVYVAISLRWGSLWYVSNAVPYLFSLLKLDPQMGYVTAMPLAAKLHIINAFTIIAVFPFTRLVHMLSLPVTYLWRSYQLVIWNKRDLQNSPEAPAPTGQEEPKEEVKPKTQLSGG